MKNKKIILIILITLIAVIWIGLAIFIPKMNENKENNSDPNAAELILFYWKTCPHCKAEEWYLDTLKETYNFKIVWYEVYYSKENREMMKDYGEQFWTEFNSVPVVIMWDDYIIWANYDKTLNLLEKYATKKGDDGCLPDEIEDEQNTNLVIECNEEASEEKYSCDWDDENWCELQWNIDESDEGQTTKIFWKEISLKEAGPILFGIALWFADWINPCMFWVLIFLLTYLVSVGSRKKVLYSGLIFVVTTFVLYSAIMYWMHKLLFSTDFFLEYISIVKYVIWWLAIILWLIEIKDFFRYGKWVSLAIPKWAKPTLEYVTKKWTYMSAFVLAVLSTFVELPCTIWIPLAYVWAVGTKINIFAALWLYNFFFILPLLIIIFGIYYWISAFKTKDGDLAINKVSNKKIMRLVAGIILITLWVLFLTKVL